MDPRSLPPEQRARLRDLAALDEKVRGALLGHPVEDRRKLEQLQRRVHEEIRKITNPKV